MNTFFSLAGLLLGFAGAVFAFLDSWRTGSRFSSRGVKLGYEQSLNTWFWRYCGQIGFGLLVISFLLQLVAMNTQEYPNLENNRGILSTVFDPRTLISLLAALISATSVGLTVKFWLASNRPIVSVAVVTDEPGNVMTTFNLVVHNSGNRPALNVRLFASKDALNAIMHPDAKQSIISMVYDCFSEQGVIPLLLNGDAVSNGFGGTSDREGQQGLIYGSKIPVSITYSDLDGRNYQSHQMLVVKVSHVFAGSFWSPSQKSSR
ncbi:MAG: hypothetical protein NW220_16860 [Leptolyngbyaceae cyanobacterium bins.349]|nr:hypothetical protein [Leptolyngbyaceae cyanobacterium bins.349]